MIYADFNLLFLKLKFFILENSSNDSGKNCKLNFLESNLVLIDEKDFFLSIFINSKF